MGFEIRPLKATSSCMSSTDAATNFDLFSSSAPTSICSRRRLHRVLHFDLFSSYRAGRASICSRRPWVDDSGAFLRLRPAVVAGPRRRAVGRFPAIRGESSAVA